MNAQMSNQKGPSRAIAAKFSTIENTNIQILGNNNAS